MLKKIYRILITGIFVIALLLCGYYFYNFGKDEAILKLVDENILEKDYEFKESKDKTETCEINEYKDLYDNIEKGLLEARDKINLLGIKGCKSSDKVFEVVTEVIKNNPEIMYYVGGRYYRGILIPEYAKDREEILKHQEIIREKRKEILSKIAREEMTDYEKVKTVHDYIIDNTSYDCLYVEEEKIRPEAHTVYGALIEGVAVCDGYSKSMKYLLNSLGIECIIVNGTSRGVNHAWNIVNIEGEYYHVDATWDDPIAEDGIDNLIYDYLNLSDEVISKTHTWNKEKYPSCISNTYNYYYYNDLVINNYDEFYNILYQAILNKKENLNIRLLNYDENIFNVSETIKKIVHNNAFNYESIDFRYSTNQSMGTVNIILSYN